MKLIILLAVVAVACAAKLGNSYLPPRNAQSSEGSEFLDAPLSNPIVADEIPNFQRGSSQGNFNVNQQSGNDYIHVRNQANTFQSTEQLQSANYQRAYDERPERPQAALERNAAILRQDYENNGESYAYAYETENGIIHEENGVAVDGVKAQGGFSYIGDDGKQYSIRYTADENGFRPVGDHLPTPPPIPDEILKSLEQNARDEAAGVYDDGSYDQRKYGEGDSQQQYFSNSRIVNPNVVNQENYVNYANQEQGANDDDSIVTNAAPVFGQSFRNIAQGIQGGDNQETSIGLNKGYLPPISRKAFEEQSSRNGQFGIRNRKPSYSAKNGYNY